MSAVFSFQNYAKFSTIHANSYAPAMPPTNVATDSGSPAEAWQTAAGVVTPAGGALLNIAPSVAGLTWGVVGLFRTNLTTSASVNAVLWKAGSPPVSVWGSTLSPVYGRGQVVFLIPNIVADYVQITFDDPTNPDGFINVPLVVCGQVWKPSRPIGFASTVGRDVSQAETVTRGGQTDTQLLWRRRRWNIQADVLAAEAWSYLDFLLQYADTGTNVFFCPDSNSPYLQNEAIFGQMKSIADVSYPYQFADRRRWSASITERL